MGDSGPPSVPKPRQGMNTGRPRWTRDEDEEGFGPEDVDPEEDFENGSQNNHIDTTTVSIEKKNCGKWLIVR